MIHEIVFWDEESFPGPRWRLGQALSLEGDFIIVEDDNARQYLVPRALVRPRDGTHACEAGLKSKS